VPEVTPRAGCLSSPQPDSYLDSNITKLGRIINPMNPSVKPVNASSRSSGPGRPKDLEKRAAILTAAKCLFVQHGFEGTSMDAVATAAGVSKLTVYSHFGDKDSLFREAVRARCHELMPEDVYTVDPTLPIRDTLMQIAKVHGNLMVSEVAIGTWRAILSDCRQGNPRLGQMLWEEGPQRTQQLMERLLDHAEQAGQLDIPDLHIAARQFLALLKGDTHFRRLFGCEDCNSDEFQREIEANVIAAVDMFLRAYAPR